MSVDIYYFTGTGNSLAVARGIAARTGARLLPIPALLGRGSIAPEADAVGLVSPVYHKGLPLILARFVARMAGLEGKYIFAVCTYGDSPGLAARHLSLLVAARGGRLAAGFGVHMPYNYLTPSFAPRDFLASFTLRQVAAPKQRALEEKQHQALAFRGGVA